MQNASLGCDLRLAARSEVKKKETFLVPRRLIFLLFGFLCVQCSWRYVNEELETNDRRRTRIRLRRSEQTKKNDNQKESPCASRIQ